MWQKIWFFTNMGFVAMLIWYMFLQRAYADAAHRGADSAEAAEYRRRRLAAGIAALVLFVVMAGAFLANMRVNGTR